MLGIKLKDENTDLISVREYTCNTYIAMYMYMRMQQLHVHIYTCVMIRQRERKHYRENSLSLSLSLFLRNSILIVICGYVRTCFAALSTSSVIGTIFIAVYIVYLRENHSVLITYIVIMTKPFVNLSKRGQRNYLRNILNLHAANNEARPDDRHNIVGNQDREV